MIGAKVCYYEDGQKTSKINHAGHFLRKRISHVNSENSTVDEFVFGPSGCCPFLRREMLEDVRLPSGDYYDEAYFFYGEDLDLWFRAHLRGWKCLFVPSVVAWHVHASSLGGSPLLIRRPLSYQRDALKNRYLTIAKNLPRDLWLWLGPWLFLTELLTCCYFLVRSPKSLLALAAAWADVIGLLPSALRKRREIQRRRSATPQDLKVLFAGL
jgi:GT2 family glycosyltransferase